MGLPRYFEDFQIGEEITSHSFTIEPGDIRLFSACSGMSSRIHYDPEYVKTIPRLGRITVPFSMVLNIIDGFYARSVSPDNVPTFHYGYDETRCLCPVYPGDTIHSVFKLIEKTDKNDRFGVLTFETRTFNQNGEVVIFHIDKLYVGKAPVS